MNNKKIIFLFLLFLPISTNAEIRQKVENDYLNRGVSLNNSVCNSLKNSSFVIVKNEDENYFDFTPKSKNLASLMNIKMERKGVIDLFDGITKESPICFVENEEQRCYGSSEVKNYKIEWKSSFDQISKELQTFIVVNKNGKEIMNYYQGWYCSF